MKKFAFALLALFALALAAQTPIDPASAIVR
jgi:hypothetical protein